jgi:hypothetical protein
MQMRKFAAGFAITMAFATGGVTPAAPAAARAAAPPVTLQSIGPLAFGPNDVLFAADTQGATIYAFQLGAAASGSTVGTPDVAAIDQKIAGVLGTEASAITIADLAIHPTSKNAFIVVMRGQGADAKPALVRVDGAGKIEVLALDTLAHSKASLPNAPAAPAEGARRNPRADSITDMSFADGKLIVAGLSNEEFSSKLRTISYPFAAVEPGTSVEIYHGNHGALETRSPVYAFVPYKVGGRPHLIAGYLCTPLVKFSLDSLTGTQKVVGTTIAELGAGNRPIDMLVYTKDGRDYLLMSNTRRGVMKIATDGFAAASPITSRIGGTAGVPFETIAALTGVQQMDLLDATRTVIIASENGSLNMRAVPLP